MGPTPFQLCPWLGSTRIDQPSSSSSSLCCLPLILDQQVDPTHPHELHCIFIVAWIVHCCKSHNAGHPGHVLSDWQGVSLSASVMTLMSPEVTWAPLSATQEH